MIPLPSLTGGRSREHSRLAKASVENIIIEPKMALCKGHDILEPKIGDLNLGRFRRISVKTQHYTSNLNLIIKYQSYILYYVVVARYA